MVRTLTPEKNFPEECKGSEEIEPLLSDDLIEDPIRRSISSSINNSIENSARVSMCSSISNSIGMEFILIPAGEFEMGSPITRKTQKTVGKPCAQSNH